MNNIEEIKARIDAVDLISETVQLRRSGRNYTGFCPFHDNKRTPAFAVFPESGTWRCFGQCNEGGDIFKFVMKKEGWEFPEALRHLADRAGIQLRQYTPEQQALRDEHDRLRELLEDAVLFFRHHLLKTDAGAPALEYLTERGLALETIEAWGLGYAPDAWELGIQHFTGRGYSLPDLVEAGLVTERDDGRTYDRFRHRITFAIRDERGRMAGFGARTLQPDGIPKYLNSPQTVLFDKGGLLYGLDQARRAIRAEEQAVIVEGYMDVIALHQAGFANAVSPMGTALTEAQIRLLKSRARQIVLALDADAAGNQATLRGLQIARKTLDREAELAFDPRGLLRQEARLQADIRIATLPAGEDPDEVVNRDPDEWRAILENARPVVAHVMDVLAEGKRLDDPKAKREIAAEVMPLINDLPSPIERNTYIQRLARLIRVDERALLQEADSGRVVPRRARRPRSEPPAPQAEAPAGLAAASPHFQEIFCLGMLMRRPEYIFRINRALKKSGLNSIAPDDFQETAHQDLIRVILESVNQDFDAPQQVVIGSLPIALHEQADAILSATDGLQVQGDRVLEELLRSIIRLRKQSVQQNMTHLQFMMQDAQDSGGWRETDLLRAMDEFKKAKHTLDQAEGRTQDRSILIG